MANGGSRWGPFILLVALILPFLAFIKTSDLPLHDEASPPLAQSNVPTNSNSSIIPGQEAYLAAMTQLKKLSTLHDANGKTSGSRFKTGEITWIRRIALTIQRTIFPPSTSQSANQAVEDEGEKTDENKMDTWDQLLYGAVKLLEESAKLKHEKALYALAEIFLFSPYGYPRNVKRARESLEQLAALTGNSEAHHLLGHIYATGLDGNRADPALAMLYHSFAAKGGHYASQMVLGYRYLNGIAAPRSCARSLHYYHLAAQTVVKKYLSGPPGGLTLPRPGLRLSDFDGGVFGEVANQRRGKGREAQEQEIEDLLEYYKYIAFNGNFLAMLHLAETYYQGARTLPRDYTKAARHLQRLVTKLETLSGSATGGEWDKETVEIAAKAYGLLGRMYLRGEGVSSSNKTALNYFSKAAELKNDEGLYWLGMFHLDGQIANSAKPVEDGIKYLKQAAEAKHAEANAQLGIYYRNNKQYTESHKHLLSAAHRGSLLGAFHLAHYYSDGSFVEESCAVASALYKIVSEKGVWNYDHSSLAYTHHTAGELETAAIHYSMAAEMGIEVAQANVAWLIDQAKLPMPTLNRANANQTPDMPNYRMALMYWTRSANQETEASRVKQGDYYYYGLGTTSNTKQRTKGASKADLAKAALCYQHAAEKHHNAIAMWNIGWMHENGIGVPMDFHLAKRWYDASLTHNPEASLPVSLSLIKLGFKYLTSYLMGDREGEGLIAFLQPKPNPPTDPTSVDQQEPQDGVAEKAEGDTQAKESTSDNPDAAQQPKQQSQQDIEEELDMALPYKRLRSQFSPMAENNHPEAGAYGFPEDDDSIFDNFLILGLCLFVGWLVYVRQFGPPPNNNGNNRPGDNHNTPPQAEPPLPVPTTAVPDATSADEDQPQDDVMPNDHLLNGDPATGQL